MSEQDRTLSEVLQISEFWQVFMNYEGNVPLTTKGGATRPLESWKIETSFLLDKQWQSTTYHSWHDICQLSNKEGFGHAMEHTYEAYKCWCSSTSIEQSMSVFAKVSFL